MATNPWDRLPLQPFGTKQEDEIYAAVGRALTNWETLEWVLARMYSALCGAKTEGAERACGIVLISNTRNDMVVEALKCFEFGELTHKNKIKSFLKKVRNFGPRRNEIAHGVVRSVRVQGTDLGFFLAPAPSSSKYVISRTEDLNYRNSMKKFDLPWYKNLKYCYNSDQINIYADYFLHLAAEAVEHCDSITKITLETQISS